MVYIFVLALKTVCLLPIACLNLEAEFSQILDLYLDILKPTVEKVDSHIGVLPNVPIAILIACEI